MGTPQSLEILKAAFKKYDRDGNGTVDSNELQLLFEDLGWSVDQRTLLKALHLLDADNSGTIDWQEFKKWSDFAWSYRILHRSSSDDLHCVSPLESLEEEELLEDEGDRMARTNEIVKAAFQRYDINNDGVIDTMEFKCILKDLNWPCNENTIQEALWYLHGNQADSQSATITWEELSNWSKFAWAYKVLARQPRGAIWSGSTGMPIASVIMEEDEANNQSARDVLGSGVVNRKNTH